MSLRSSLSKLVSSLPSLRIRPIWAGAASAVGFLALSVGGCSGGNNSLVPCGDAGMFCVCTGYGCQPALSGSGGSSNASGQGGATVSSSGSDGTGGKSSSSTTTSSSSSGGTGGNTTGALTCNSKKPCPSPQVCLTDGYCHYPCSTLLECEHVDNRFTACTDGYCQP